MRRRILIAETEDWAVERLRGVAAQQGIDVVSCDNGIEALEHFSAVAPSLVVADAMLPKIGGMVMATKLRSSAEGRTVPIVITTALPPDEEDLASLRAEYGFTTILAKPFDELAAETVLIPLLIEEPDCRGTVDGQAPTLISPGNAMGQIRERCLGEYLLELMRERRTGILTVRYNGVTKEVKLDCGQVVHAISNSARDDLGRLLMLTGILSARQVEDVKAYQLAKFVRHFPTAVLDKGFLSEGELRRGLVMRMSHIVVGLVPLSQVELSFRALAHLPAQAERFEEIDAANLLFWAMRRLDGAGNFRARLPSTESIVSRTSVAEATRRSLRLSALEEQLLSLADGRRHLGDVLSLVLVDVDISRIMLSLLAFGLVEARVTDPLPQSLEPQTAQAGKIGEVLVATVFVQLARRQATGILRLNRNDEWRRIHLNRGEIVWAMSSLDNHRLGTVLLDVGAVAESDLKEALVAQAATTGGRLAGILFEHGDLTLEELDRGRREQIKRIVFDALSWDQGDWQFEPKATEGQERVTLNVRTSELVFESLIHLPSPPTVRELLRSTDTILMTNWDEQRVNNELSLSRSEKLILEVLEAGQTGAELSAFGLTSLDELERVMHGFLVLEIVRTLKGELGAHLGSESTVHEESTLLELDELDEPGPLLSDHHQQDEDSVIIRLGAIDKWLPNADNLRRDLELFKAENARLKERVERLEAALDRRSNRSRH